MIRSAAVIFGRKTSQTVRTRIPTFSSLSANGNSLFGNYGIRIHNNNRRYYTPMTIEEEEKEKARCSHLSPEEKETELRSLNREISKLETLRGINNGERYTWSGRYKELVRNYGFPLFVYYWSVWTTMGVSIYIGIDVFGFDAMSLLDNIDTYMNWSLGDKVDPQFGKMGLALVVNECFEPLRLPFVVMTLKPVMDQVSPTKY